MTPTIIHIDNDGGGLRRGPGLCRDRLAPADSLPGPQSRKGLIQLLNYESNCNSARVDALVFANGSAATSKLGPKYTVGDR
jgi:hypothetical protein